MKVCDMMIQYLIYIANGLILSGFIGYFFLVVFSNKKITNSNGFNVTKDILNEYDSINIIENKSYFTVYNIKRKVIKIASKCYYGNTLSDVAIPLIEAGTSIIHDKKNKFINVCSNILPNLKLLYILPMLAVILNTNSYGTTDAKIGIIILIVLCFISYMVIGIKTEIYNWLGKKISKSDVSKENVPKVINFVNKVILMDKFIFLGEAVMIIRFVAMLLNN